jgi:DNA-binding transcriptional ArsR family regulator
MMPRCETSEVHLIPRELADRRIIDGEQACVAIEALTNVPDLPGWGERFALLGDATRLRLLIAIRAAGPISVSDLAVATNLTDDHVSQTLRFLRAARAVSAERDGRVVRYQLADQVLADLVAKAAT